MSLDFKIFRGNKENLIDEDGNYKLSPEKLVNGYWYLTNDTAEVYVCLEVEGQLTLRKINECDVPSDFPDIDSFEERLSALESQERLHTYAELSQLPSVGVVNHMYAVLDENATYIYTSEGYVCVGNTEDDYDIIHGGSASV